MEVLVDINVWNNEARAIVVALDFDPVFCSKTLTACTQHILCRQCPAAADRGPLIQELVYHIDEFIMPSMPLELDGLTLEECNIRILGWLTGDK